MFHLLGAHDGELQLRLATDLTTGLRALTVGGIVATALAAWMALRRWHAVALAVMAPAATFVVDRLLKPLVARKAPGSPVFHHPSGHVVVATALALSLVLILRPSMVRPRVRTLLGLSAALLVALMGLACLAETAHLLTDLAGGLSAGVAVTLAAALLVDRDGRSVRGGLIDLHPRVLGRRAYSGQTGSGSATTAAAIHEPPVAGAERGDGSRNDLATSARAEVALDWAKPAAVASDAGHQDRRIAPAVEP